MTTIRRHRDWKAGQVDRLGTSDVLFVEHPDGRVVRFEFDSDDAHIYVYTRRYRRLASGATTGGEYDAVRRFPRRMEVAA